MQYTVRSSVLLHRRLKSRYRAMPVAHTYIILWKESLVM
jgi:hypothetical protein